MPFKSQIEHMDGIYAALFAAGENIYAVLKKGTGLKFATSSNESGDDQLELDVIADEAFFETLSKDDHIRYVVSEERPNMVKLSDGPYSVALDPLDGSKSALVGIPSGAIFGVFTSVDDEPDFNGKNIISGGFFVFGMNLEVFFADGDKVYSGLFDQDLKTWHVTPIEGGLPHSNVLSVNASAQREWEPWMQAHFQDLLDPKGGTRKPHNVRWYASMVSDMKRCVLQGGMFLYPSSTRKGYENGHLRLVYEAIPIAFMIHAMGGSSSNGNVSFMEAPVTTLHQKTPVFIGEKAEIEAVEAAKKNA